MKRQLNANSNFRRKIAIGYNTFNFERALLTTDFRRKIRSNKLNNWKSSRFRFYMILIGDDARGLPAGNVGSAGVIWPVKYLRETFRNANNNWRRRRSKIFSPLAVAYRFIRQLMKLMRIGGGRGDGRSHAALGATRNRDLRNVIADQSNRYR